MSGLGSLGHSNERRHASKSLDHQAPSAFSVAAEITEPVSKTILAVHISNVGLHGCWANSAHVLPVGSVVKLSVRHSLSHFDSKATVVQSIPDQGMGLIFTYLTPKLKSDIQILIAQAPISALEASDDEGSRGEMQFVSAGTLDTTDGAAGYTGNIAVALSPSNVWGKVVIGVLLCVIFWSSARILQSLMTLLK